jgi:hypothetical protein
MLQVGAAGIEEEEEDDGVGGQNRVQINGYKTVQEKRLKSNSGVIGEGDKDKK